MTNQSTTTASLLAGHRQATGQKTTRQQKVCEQDHTDAMSPKPPGDTL